MSVRLPGDLACPHCGGSKSRVTNTYGNVAGDCISRRRECLSCRERYTSHERLPDARLAEQAERLGAEVAALRQMLRERVS